MNNLPSHLRSYIWLLFNYSMEYEKMEAEAIIYLKVLPMIATNLLPSRHT
uniref:Uncharacterized protein n=1 Tax=Arundo donax TaxID=35708 RepID=A0A0A8ZSZ3_ARUDO